MADDNKDVLLDRWRQRLKNQPILAALILFAAAVGGIATFTDSVSKIAKIVRGKQEQTQEKTSQEILQIELRSPKLDSMVTLLKDEFGQPAILETAWECILSNNGAITLSIISYKLEVERSTNGPYWYDMLDRRIYDQATKRQISLPLKLESGESVQVELRIGLTICRPAYEILEKESLVAKTLKYERIRDIVARHGLDIYCHAVKYHQESPAGLPRIEGPDPMETYKGQIISIIAKTGRGGMFRATEPWQPLSNVWREGRPIPTEGRKN